MLKHIYQDERRITHFDPYFDYIESVKSELPPGLHAFASDVSRYELNGPRTLHDAWLEDFRCSTEYAQDSNEITAASVILRLRRRKSGGGTTVLTYSRVEGVEYHGMPSSRPDRACDLLVHEVTVHADGLYSHALVFDKGIAMSILFRAFSLEDIAP